MELILLALYFLVVYLYSVRTDTDAARLTSLSIGTEDLPEWRIVNAKAFANRRCGLLNHIELAPMTGLLLQKSRSVHTLGMLFPVDLVFIDGNDSVLAVKENVAPGEKRIAGPRGTRKILELPARSLQAERRLAQGATLTFRPRASTPVSVETPAVS